ncbi:poly(3-hydroxyalkanoate) depolymerase [Pontixanthobacter gangjinensis]|nr:alpha/beta hydrolase [Pontixanthobacter gangjinensis]
MTDPMASAEVSIENVGGRDLRIARWRLDEPSDHPPILFFNGIGANIEAVAPMAEAFSDRSFIMFDMPGIGGSPAPLVPYNVVTMAWTATQVLDLYGLDQVDVMGISWGGGMAQHFAIQHPGRTRKLVLIATSAGMLMVPGSPKALTKMANPRRYIDPEFMTKNFETLYGEGLGSGPGKGAHMSRLTPPSPRGYMYQLIAMLGWTSAPALPFMKKETLILMGDDDAIVPLANGKFLRSLIPNSELVVMEGGGHLFLLSHKDESVAAIRAHLDVIDDAEQSKAA